VKIKSYDCFCGGGGWTEGEYQACSDLGISINQHVCINHWKPAIMTHAANHGYAIHICDKLDQVDWNKYGQCDAFIASPPCVKFSRAKGTKPNKDQLRTSVKKVIEGIFLTKPSFYAMENVPEFMTHDPSLFNSELVKPLRDMGYSCNWRVLNCANYGDPTTRERLFIAGRLDGSDVVWPAPTHFETPGLLQRAWVPASDIIDFSLPSKSIFNRKIPLVKKTMSRIIHGLEKQGPVAEPFLIILRGQSKSRSINKPIPTLTTGQHIGLVQPFLTKLYGTGKTASINKPLHTVTAGGNKFGLVQPFIVKYYGTAKTISIDAPLHTVTCRDRFGLVQQVGIDLHYRMLQPKELAAAMGFPEKYLWYGNKTQIVRQIGNAVPVNTAKALLKCLLEQTICMEKVG